MFKKASYFPIIDVVKCTLHICWLLMLWMAMLMHQVAMGQCEVGRVHFKAGEELRYNVHYNWGFVWIDGGTVVFRVEDGGKGKFKISGEGRTYPSRDWIFKIRDQYIAIIDQFTLRPIYASRSNREGDFWCEHKYYFNAEHKKIVSETEELGKSFSRDSIDYNSCYIDLMTAVCLVRCHDFSLLNTNDRIELQTLIGKEVQPLNFRYLGKVNITIGSTKQTYRCHKLKVNLIAGSMFNEGENMSVWVTDDDNRIPIQFEAGILVGSVKAIISSFKGLKYPMKAIVE